MAEENQNDNMEAMAQFFRRAMGFQGIPTNKLIKFRGSPQRPGEPTLAEWLDEFREAISGYELSDKEKAKTLIDHLVGPAKEEVLCLPEKDRESESTVIEALQLCFGLEDSMQSLGTVFHNAHQKEGESLADFSRQLLRLHSRMVAAAKTDADSKALKQLRDRALKDQFCRGAREPWVRRELRRIDLATKGTFDDVRKEALLLFNDPETVGRRVRIRELGQDVTQVSVDNAALHKESSYDVLARELAETRKELQSLKVVATEVQDLKRLVKEL
ncbi:hypothetical protein BSL78_16069 [Apostichopus japonicus]|uniref:Paraneoplastic antigen Ma-like C-terminal domain-containing protein n=1 Tax=Stichopus japonicus TaxID=307972 RepID=A0A2G8KGF1_STIJA|nr:hypothetical protein BSL78_16069 [Apostichopus japonicus]